MKIGLDDKTHREFKVWCVQNGQSMGSAAVGLIMKAVSALPKDNPVRGAEAGSVVEPRKAVVKAAPVKSE